jgi:DNA-binding MarR family transcriptional regulator
MSRGTAEPLAAQIERLFLLLLRQGEETTDTQQLPLTRTQRLALAIVADRSPLRLRTLSDLMATTDATASRTVDALERLDLVRRDSDPADRRGVLVAATDSARRLVAARRRRLRRSVERGLGTMTLDDQERLVSLLARLNDVLES